MKLLGAARLTVTAIKTVQITTFSDGAASAMHSRRATQTSCTQGSGHGRTVFPLCEALFILVLGLTPYASISVQVREVYAANPATLHHGKIHEERLRDRERDKEALHCGYAEKEEEDICVETVELQEPYSCLKREKQISCRPTITAAPRICHKVGVRWKTKACTLVDYELKCTHRLVDKQETCVKEWMVQQAYPCALSSTVESCKTAETPIKEQCTRSVVKPVPYTCIKEDLETFCDDHPAFVMKHPGGPADGSNTREEAAQMKKRFSPLQLLKHKYIDTTSTRRLADTVVGAASLARDTEGQGSEAARTRRGSACLEAREQHVPYRCSRSRAKPECKTVKRKETAPCIKDTPFVSTFDCSYTEVQLSCSGMPLTYLNGSNKEEKQSDFAEKRDVDRAEEDVDPPLTGKRNLQEQSTSSNFAASSETAQDAQSEGQREATKRARDRPVGKNVGSRDLRKAADIAFYQSSQYPSTALVGYTSPQKDCHYLPVTVRRRCKEILIKRVEDKCEIESEEKVCKTITHDEAHICYMKNTTKELVDCNGQQALMATGVKGRNLLTLLTDPLEALSKGKQASVVAAQLKSELATRSGSTAFGTSAATTRPRMLSAPLNCVTRVVARKDTCTKKLPFTEHFPCTSLVPVTTCSPSRNVDATTCYRAVQKSMEYSCVKPAKVEECIPVPVHRQGTCYEQEEYRESFECEETRVQQVCQEEEKEIHSQCMKTVQRELSYPCLKKKKIPICKKDLAAHTAIDRKEQLHSRELLPQQLLPSLQPLTTLHKVNTAAVSKIQPPKLPTELTLHGASAEGPTEAVVPHLGPDEQTSLSGVRSAALHALALAHSAAAEAAEAAEAAGGSEEQELAQSVDFDVDADGEEHTALQSEQVMQAATTLQTAERTTSPARVSEAISSAAPCRSDSVMLTGSSSALSARESSKINRRASTPTGGTSRRNSGGNARRSNRASESKSVDTTNTSRSKFSPIGDKVGGALARRLLPSFKPLGLKAKRTPHFSPTTTQLPPSPAPVNRVFLGPRGHLLNEGVGSVHGHPAAEPHVHNHQPVVLPDPATVDMHDLLNQHRKYTLTSPDKILPHIPPKIVPAGPLHHQHHLPLLAEEHLHLALPAQHIHHVAPVIPPHKGAISAPTSPHVLQSTHELDTQPAVADFKPVAPLMPGSRVPSLLETDISSPWYSAPPLNTGTLEQQTEKAAGGPPPHVAEEESSEDSPDPARTPASQSGAETASPGTDERAPSVPPPHPYLHPHPGSGVLPLGYAASVGVPPGVSSVAVAPPGVMALPEQTVMTPVAVLPPAPAVYPAAGPVPVPPPPYPHPFPYAHAPEAAIAHMHAGVPIPHPIHIPGPPYPVHEGTVLHGPLGGLPVSPVAVANYHTYPHMHLPPIPIPGPVGHPPAVVPQPPPPPPVAYVDAGDRYQASDVVSQKPAQLQEILLPARSALPEFQKLQELTAEIHYLMKLQRQQKGRLSESHRQRLKQITVELEQLAGIHHILPDAAETNQTSEYIMEDEENNQPSQRPLSDSCSQDVPPASAQNKDRCEGARRRSGQPKGAGSSTKPAKPSSSNLRSPLTESREISPGGARGGGQTPGGNDVATQSGRQRPHAAGSKQLTSVPRKSGVDSEELEHVLGALLAELKADESALFEELRKPELTVEEAEDLTEELALLREDIRIVADGRARLFTGELSYEEIQNLWAFLLGEGPPASEGTDASEQIWDVMQEDGATLQDTDEADGRFEPSQSYGPASTNSSGTAALPSKSADLLSVSAESAALAAAAAALHKVMSATFARIPLIAHHIVPDSMEETQMADYAYATVHPNASMHLGAPVATVAPHPSSLGATHAPPIHPSHHQDYHHRPPHHHYSTVVHPEPLGAREAMLAAALKGAYEIKARIMDSIHALRQLLDTTEMPLEREAEAKQLLSALQRDLLRVQQLVGRLHHGKGLSTEDLQYISMQLEAVNGSTKASSQSPNSNGGQEGENDGNDGGPMRGGAAAMPGTEEGSNGRLYPNTDATVGRMQQTGGAEGGQQTPTLPSPLAAPTASGGGTNSDNAPARTNVYITINIDENGDLDLLNPRRKDG